jgi:hypothetical protein
MCKIPVENRQVQQIRYFHACYKKSVESNSSWEDNLSQALISREYPIRKKFNLMSYICLSNNETESVVTVDVLTLSKLGL